MTSSQTARVLNTTSICEGERVSPEEVNTFTLSQTEPGVKLPGGIPYTPYLSGLSFPLLKNEANATVDLIGSQH